jgi:DNA-binding NarL/FixJ family response regulator
MNIAMGRVYLVVHHPGFRDALAVTIQKQGQSRLLVVGGGGWTAGELGVIGLAQPDVIVLVLGVETGTELRLLTYLRALVPGCRMLVIDTLGGASTWQSYGWGMADALLRPEQLATGLVPAICRLLVQRGAISAQTGGDVSPPAALA